MKSNEVLIETFGRIGGVVRASVKDLTPEQLAHRIDPEANSIVWLIWHLTRIQDDHIAGVSGGKQVWLSEGWKDRFGLPFEERAHGYGHSPEEVAQVKGIEGSLLVDYYEAVHARTHAFLLTLDAADLDKVVDRNWDPPVTIGARLVSIISDNLQHAGQAAYLRGLILRGDQ